MEKTSPLTDLPASSTGAILDTELRGNTLKVYTHMFKVRTSNMREVQHKLNLKSPALAQYHLDKLVALGLLKRDEQSGDYSLTREVKVEALQHFFRVGSLIVPRFLFYLVTVTALFLYYFVFVAGVRVNEQDIWTLILGGMATVIIWYETIGAWRGRPSR